MSTSGGPNRTRSIRQPSTTTTTNTSNTRSSNEQRNTSPSRLPIKPLARSSTVSSTASTSAPSGTVTGRSRATSTSTTASSGSRPPLSNLFTGRGSVAGRRASPTTSVENATAGGTTSTTGRPFGRARQASVATTVSTTSTGTTSNSVRTTTSSNLPPASTTSRPRQTVHGRAKSTVTNLTLRPTSTQIPPVTTSNSNSNSNSNNSGSNTSSNEFSNGNGNRNRSTTPTTSTTTTSTAIPNKPQTRAQTLRARSQSQSQGSVAGSTISASTVSTIGNAHGAAGGHTQQPHVQPQPQPQMQPHRPAFNTHQQHYSPLKAQGPKPLTSTFLALPSPSKLPANVALSAETSRLQAELLQLALLRRDAPAVDAEWRASARRALGGRFAALRAHDADAASAERDRAERRNAASLLRWASASASSAPYASTRASRRPGPTADDMGVLDEKIRALDEILDGVWGLGDPDGDGDSDGRYARTVRAFEAWVGRAAKVLAAQRRGGDVGGDDAVMFLSDLDDGGWRAECAGLTRRVEGWGRALRELGDVPDDDFDDDDGDAGEEEHEHNDGEDDEDEDEDEDGGFGRRRRRERPALARILRGCAALVDGMLAELETMTQIERDAAAAEDEWVERMGRELRADTAARGDFDTPGRGLSSGHIAAPLWSTAI